MWYSKIKTLSSSSRATLALVDVMYDHVSWITFGATDKYRDGLVTMDMDLITTYDGTGACQAILFDGNMGEKHLEILKLFAKQLGDNWTMTIFPISNSVRFYRNDY